MGRLIRDYDWSKTSIGSIAQWPKSLQMTLGILLHSAFPMFLFWGKDFLCFYNDAYRPSLGENGKHPAIGKKGKEVWPEIWDFIGPLIDNVMNTGEPVWFEDQLVPIYRNGKIEDVWWTFSYSAVYNDDEQINGVFVTCTETTQKVLNHEKLVESESQLKFAIEATELGTWDYDPLTNRITANERVKKWFGFPGADHIDLNEAILAIAENDRQRVTEAIQQALQYESGGYYDIEYSIINPVASGGSIVRAKGRAWFNEDKLAYRFNGTLQDVTTQATARRKVEESEMRYNKMLMESPFAFAIFKGRDMVIALANDSMKEVLGKGTDIEGKPLLDVLPELNGQSFPSLLDDVYTTGIPYYANEALAKLYRNDRIEDVYFNFVYQPYREVDDSISGITVIAYECTNEVIAKQKIAESEKLLHLITDALPVLVAYIDKDRKYRFNNKTYEAWFGHTLDEISGRSMEEILGEKAYKELKSKVDEVLEGKPVHFEGRVAYKDGGDRYIAADYIPHFATDGKVLGFYVAVNDITQTNAIRRTEIIESEERFRTLAETLPQLVWITNEKGDQEYASSRWQEYSGIEPVEPNTWTQMVHPDDLDEIAQTWINSMNTGSVYRTEVRLRNKAGDFRWHFAQGEPIRNEKGEIIKWIGAFTDIHDQKTIAERLENLVAERTRELKEKNYELQRSIDLLHSQELKDEQKNNFIAMASHELKTPITSIKGYVQLLLTAFDNKKQGGQSLSPLLVRSSLISVDKQITRLTRLISELLDLSNIETGTLQLRKDRFSLNELAIETVEDILYTNTTHTINLLHDFKTYVHADKDRIGQVMINFLTNAIKYSPNSERIDVRIHRTINGEVAFSVKDYGIGIEKDEQGKDI